jgi:hypothetical protein
MGFIDRITRRAAAGARQRVTPRPLSGVDDLARMGLAPLDTVAAALTPVADRRRADDWETPARTVETVETAETWDERRLA